MIDIDDFKKEVSCEYKGETYSVRDNGAIMRHPKKGCRVRSLDNQWTFWQEKQNQWVYVFCFKHPCPSSRCYCFLGT